MTKPVLTTQALTIGYTRPAHTVATDLNLVLSAGEMVCLIGPNGAGKTTLMRTLAGMQPALAGQVRLLGDEVQSMPSRVLAQRLSVVLTGRVDVGMLSGYGLVALGRHPYTDWTGQLSGDDETIVRRAVQAVGAEDIAPRNVTTLSDGERQKLMIARALAQEPALMILDEPTAYLDLPRRVEIMQLLRRLARATDRAILLSTHDLDLALRNADRLWLMPKGDAIHTGAPEDLILNGTFEAAFASEGVQFDPRTGSFRSNAERSRRVMVRGEGVRRIWTERALERAGFRVVDSDPSHTEEPLLRVDVLLDSWQLRHDSQTLTVDSVHELVNMLRA
jgi:iron complex transport system ATP-binding protein